MVWLHQGPIFYTQLGGVPFSVLLHEPGLMKFMQVHFFVVKTNKHSEMLWCSLVVIALWRNRDHSELWLQLVYRVAGTLFNQLEREGWPKKFCTSKDLKSLFVRICLVISSWSVGVGNTVKAACTCHVSSTGMSKYFYECMTIALSLLSCWLSFSA